MKRTASAVWKGGLKDGNGTVSSESGVLSKVAYSFAKRFGDEKGTNPEELIGAAHAGCFSMALSGELGKVELTATSIETTATVTMEKTDAGMTVTAIHLDVAIHVPGADKAAVLAAAEGAKKGCPISRLLSAATITMTATVVS